MQTRADLLVVDDTHFYAVGAKLAHAGQGMDLAELLALAEGMHAKHVWIVPGTEVSRVCSDASQALAGWDITATYLNPTAKDIYSYVSARRVNARHEDRIQVGFVEHSRWPWKASSSSPKWLLATITYLENALGLPVEWTPAHMSLEYVRKKNEARWNWLAPMTLDLEKEQVAFSYANDVAKELHWPPKGVEKQIPAEATHYIRIDGNSAYAAGMTGLNIGEGNPKWAPPGPAVDAAPGAIYDGKKPGIWFVEIFNEGTVWDGKRLPALDSWRCMTTDMIEQARRSGCVVHVKMGWYWSEYHQTLRSTAEDLWKLRVEWRSQVSKSPAHESVHESLRVIIKAIHGRLARPDNSPHFRRRDIWALVVARSVAMTIYRIEKIHRDFGLWPVAIKADELTYAVSDPHMLDSIVDRNKLGGFKLVSIDEIQRTN